MMTVTTTCKLQQRNRYDYINPAVAANLKKEPAPSVLYQEELTVPSKKQLKLIEVDEQLHPKTLATRRHTFSHYHLNYTPVLIQTDNLINFVMEGNQTVWYNASQINTLGLPAPIKQLLQQHTRG